MNEHLQAARDILRFHGIEANQVSVDGVYAEGYDLFRLDAEGRRIIKETPDGYEIEVDFTPWPESFPVASFFEHYWAWKGAVV